MSNRALGFDGGLMKKGLHGKIRLDAETFLMPSGRRIDASVYLHLKGYVRARVTHLDVEKMGLGRIIQRGRGNFLEVKGVRQGLEVFVREGRTIEIDGEQTQVSSIAIIFEPLNEVLKEGKSTRAWVGRKYDGIYIGFKREELQKLEKVAVERFGAKPLRKLEKAPFKTEKLER